MVVSLLSSSEWKRTLQLSSKRSQETKNTLASVSVLADFANLETADVETFRSKHPDFAVPAWWEYQSDLAKSGGMSKHWQLVQQYVQEAWISWQSESEVSLEAWLRLLTSVFDPESLLDVMIPSPTNPKYPAFATATQLAEMTPYHKALEFVAEKPWRAKFCEECHMRFVADHARRKYCSLANADGTNCSARAIKRQHRDWGRENNWGRVKIKNHRRK
jgi:hypothetical protein